MSTDRDGPGRARYRRLMGLQYEWFVDTWMRNGQKRFILQSNTHDDDVVMEISGNFTDEQAYRVATEICEQLNAAERKYDEEIQHEV